MRKCLAPAASLAVAGTLAFAPAGTAGAAVVAPDTTVLSTSVPGTASEVETDYGRMMLVLDSSGSMKEETAGGQSKIQAARQALRTVIGDLPDEADVGLQVFGATVFSRNDQSACRDTQVVVEPGTDNRQEMLDAVGDYKPYGETPIPAALKAAARALGSEGKRSIVLVSDGESTCGNPCDEAARIANAGIDIQIDVVGLSVSGKAKQQLQCIATKGHGTYYDADDADELSSSLGRISERAVRPFVVQGTPVTGTASPTEAPEITSGVWRDDLPGEGEARHYRIKREIAGSTLWAGSVSQPGLSQQQVKVEFLTIDGSSCGAGYNNNGIRKQERSSLLGAAAMSKGDEPCNDADALILSVAKTQWSDGDSDVEMQLIIHEEPPLATRDGLPPGQDWDDLTWEPVELSGEPQQITPGSGLNDAPLLEQGRYRTDGIVPGESQVYKVHLDWGESLQVHGVLPVHEDGHKAFGLFPPVVRLSVIAPDGAMLSPGLSVRDEHDTMLLPFASPPTDGAQGTGHLHLKTHTVRWLNREQVNIEDQALPGDYYIIASQDAHDESVVTPLDLEISTVGTPGEGTPQYVGAEEIAGPDSGDGADPDEAEATSGDAAQARDEEKAEESGANLELVAGGGAIGLGLVAIGIAVAMLLRRRRI